MKIATFEDFGRIIDFLENRCCEIDLEQKYIISENEGVINGLCGYSCRVSGHYNIFTISLLDGMSRKIKRDIIKYIKHDILSSIKIFSNNKNIIYAPNDNIYLEFEFKQKDNTMVYRDSYVYLTVCLYQDAGEYIKTNPKIVKEAIKADSEHDARREVFNKYSKDWYIKSIEIDNNMETVEV